MSTINKVKVEQFEGNNGPVKNQFLITTDEGVYFQSYDSIIAFMPFGHRYNPEKKIKLDKTYWDYSVTTGKYRNIFLEENKKETERKIKSGEYELVDLNGG